MSSHPKKFVSTLISFVGLCAVLSCLACSSSGKKNAGGTAGASGAGGGAGTTAGASGTSAGAGAGESGGTSGASGSGGNGGTSANDASVAMDASQDASQDAGHDAGTGLLKCSAPSPASSVGNTCPSGNPVTLKTTSMAGGGFSFPVFVTHSPNDPEGRLFVVERGGAIKIIKNGSTLPTPFLTVNEYSGQNEQGLLGLAFDPNYETTGRFWVNYTASNAQATSGTITTVESYVVSTDPDVADPSTKTPLLTVEDPEWNHNGGMLAFGPDHCLYIATGDGGGGDDLHTNHGSGGNGQSLTTELAKILRVDVADKDARPAGNLSSAMTSIPWVWDWGLRNPWRFSFDRETGDLYIGDVGQVRWEEVNVEPRGQGNKNYGWRPMEGKHCRGDLQGTALGATCASLPVTQFTQPVHDYYHASGDNCVIGGYVYRGANIPSLRGYYLYADHGSNKIWAFVWNGTGMCSGPIDLTSQLGITGAITSFGEDVDGELYVTTEGGNVYRIDPA